MSVGIDLERFDNFKDAEFRSLEIISPTNIEVTFAVQDKARAFDWITLTLKFFGVKDARLIDGAKIAYVDMSDGISMIKENGTFACGIGAYKDAASLQNATCYILADDFKSQEGLF